MNKLASDIFTFWVLLFALLLLPASAIAMNPVKLGEDVVQALAKAPGLVHSTQTMKSLARIERIGGRPMRDKAERLAANHGSGAIEVIAKDPKLLLPALERFSFNDQAKLLGSFRRNPELLRAFNRYGDGLLRLELRSKGQAMHIVGVFGADGLKLADKLTAKQLGIMAVESGRFSQASVGTIKGFLDMAGKYTGKVFDWLEKHPRVLYTATGAALVVEMKTELLGDPEAGTQGVVQQVANSGFGMLAEVFKVFAPWGAGALFLWLSFRSWLHRPKRIDPEQKDQEKRL